MADNNNNDNNNIVNNDNNDNNNNNNRSDKNKNNNRNSNNSFLSNFPLIATCSAAEPEEQTLIPKPTAAEFDHSSFQGDALQMFVLQKHGIDKDDHKNLNHKQIVAASLTKK